MKRCVILILFLPIGLFSAAQPAPLSFRNISINEGLSQSSVTDMVVDETGFIWMATQDGLNRYDGKSFLIYRKNFDDITTAVSSRLGKIFNGGKNQLWLITSGGKVEMLNTNTSQFTPLEKIVKKNLPSSHVSYLLYEDPNNLWIGTAREGLFLYHPATGESVHFTTVTHSPLAISSNVIQYIFKSSKSQYWVLTDKGVTVITSHLAPGQSFLDDPDDVNGSISCSAMDEDKDHNLWLGSFGKGLYLKKETDSTFQAFTGFSTSQQIPGNLVIEAVRAGSDGSIWVGTYGNGLFIIHPKTKTIQHLLSDKKDPFSLGYNDVLCIKQDPQQGMWVGTDGGGVSHYDRRLNNFSLFDRSNVPQNISIEQVRSISTDSDGGIWVGTSNSGLTYIDVTNNTFQTVHLPSFGKGTGNPDRIVSLLPDEEGDIWISSQGNGLVIMDRKSKQIKERFSPGLPGTKFIPDNTVWCMMPTPAGIWAGTRNSGLCLLDKKRGLLKNFTDTSIGNALPENNVRALTTINDSIICIGFEKKGIRFLNVNANQLRNLPDSIQDKITADNTILKCIAYQQPYLWIGTQGKGLLAYNIKTNTIISITEKEGLPNNTIYGILRDASGYFWMSTNKGICRFAVPENLSAVSRTHFMLFTASDGLQSNEFNTGAWHKASDGRFFFGGINGLNVFNPSTLDNTNPPTKVVITGATINNEPLQSDTSVSFKKILKLPYHQNSLSFNFAALDFISPGRVSYFYQLQGHDKNWIDAGNRNYAAYTNLAPGKYTFRVKASSSVVSKDDDPETTLNITITPPFWKTWWFIALCLLLIIGLLYAFYRYRIGQLLHLQKIRNRIATDLHDDIGSTLTNISILSELSLKNIDQQDKAAVFLGRITEEVSHSSQALDDIVWSINSKHDTLEQTVVRMRRYAAEIFDAANINYTLQLDEQFAHKKLNMEQRRDCFLVFKEIINNIYKHAQAKNVLIKLWIDHNDLHLKVTDDGKGFDPTAATHRNGIKNIYQRIEKWSGNVVIESTSGKGTTTKIHFPIV